MLCIYKYGKGVRSRGAKIKRRQYAGIAGDNTHGLDGRALVKRWVMANTWFAVMACHSMNDSWSLDCAKCGWYLESAKGRTTAVVLGQRAGRLKLSSFPRPPPHLRFLFRHRNDCFETRRLSLCSLDPQASATQATLLSVVTSAGYLPAVSEDRSADSPRST